MRRRESPRTCGRRRFAAAARDLLVAAAVACLGLGSLAGCGDTEVHRAPVDADTTLTDSSPAPDSVAGGSDTTGQPDQSAADTGNPWVPADTGPAQDTASPPDTGTAQDTSTAQDTGADVPLGTVQPPLGGSSGGSGGSASAGAEQTTPGGVRYRLIVPGSYAPAQPNALMIVYSGTEGAATMTSNLQGAGPAMGLGDVMFAVLDGPTYRGNGAAGADVLDHVRGRYDIDNDRTYLLSESAGTTAGYDLGFSQRPSYFAAYWANDVTGGATPTRTAAQLGFAPWGNAGPGGAFAAAATVVAGMEAAGYRIAQPAPYDGAGAGTHGSPQQFMAALQWFVGKRR